MTEEQARGLFLNYCQPGNRGTLERYGEKAAVQAILAAIASVREVLAEGYKSLSGKAYHTSDCATSSAPAYDPGPCDCGTPSSPVTNQMTEGEVRTLLVDELANELRQYRHSQMASAALAEHILAIPRIHDALTPSSPVTGDASPLPLSSDQLHHAGADHAPSSRSRDDE